MLTWTGAVLLALGAVAFAAWAWILLGDLGRLGLLVAATVVMGILARASRRRAPNTAEALSLVSLTMLVVDWTVAQPSSVDPADWFVGGLALAATVALAAAARGGWRALPVAGVVLADAAALGAAWRIADRSLDDQAPTGSVVALAALAVAPLLALALMAACDRVAGWSPARRTSHWAAGLVWFLAGIGALTVWEPQAVATDEVLGWLAPNPWRTAVLCLLTASLAAAPLLALRRPDWGAPTRGLLGGAAALAPIGALTLTLAAWLPRPGSEALLTGLVAFTSLAAAGGALLRAAPAPPARRAGPPGGGATIAAAGVGALASGSAWLLAAPTLEQSRPWSAAADAWASSGRLALVAAGVVVLAACAARARKPRSDSCSSAWRRWRSGSPRPRWRCWRSGAHLRPGCW